MIAAKPTEHRQMLEDADGSYAAGATADRYRTLSERIRVADARLIYSRWRDAADVDAAKTDAATTDSQVATATTAETAAAHAQAMAAGRTIDADRGAPPAVRSPTPMMRIAPDRRDATMPRCGRRRCARNSPRTTMARTGGDRLLDHLRSQPGWERALAAALNDDLDRRDGHTRRPRPTVRHRPAPPSPRRSRRRNRSTPPPTPPYSAPAPPPTRPAGLSPASTPRSVTRRRPRTARPPRWKASRRKPPTSTRVTPGSQWRRTRLDRMAGETDTRYLIVTHNAVTMSRMHRLFGVTMIELGGSRLVSVDLQDAKRLLAAELRS